MVPKVPTVLKNASNKKCIKSNSLKKTQWVHKSISPSSGARGSKDLPFLKYNTQEWEWQNLGTPSSTTGRDRHMRPVRFS